MLNALMLLFISLGISQSAASGTLLFAWEDFPGARIPPP